MSTILIADRMARAGGRALLVGGCVRDVVLAHIKPKDYDIEVYGLDVATVRSVLDGIAAQYGRHVNAVGASFGVFKLRFDDTDYDISLPRRDSKVGGDGGRGRGFVITPDPNMSIEEAAARRDFTINSMAMDPLTGEVFDPYNGRGDWEKGILRATSEHFAEDPLRVLRGMQFCGRFDLMPDAHTASICADLGDQLAIERIAEEWMKWASKSDTPGRGIQFLFYTFWLDHYPAIKKLWGCIQDPEWHPEGTVWRHTLHCLARSALVAIRDNLNAFDRAVLTFAVLLHDCGKPETTYTDDRGRIVSPGHAQAGGPIAEAFLKSIGIHQSIIDHVVPLVTCHMDHIGATVNSRFVRRLAARLHPATIEMWEHVVECDASGRPPLPASRPGLPVLEFAQQEGTMQHGRPAPILMGRHLIDRMDPGPAMGAVLARAYEAQLDGAFSSLEGALDWLNGLDY